MPSTVTIYNNALKEMANGAINFYGTTNFKLLLVGTGSTYTPSKSHTTRTNFTANGGAEASGSGYSAGGATVTFTTSSVTVDNTNNVINIAIPTVDWANSTISSKGAVLYTNTGNPTTDKLVAYCDFGSTVSSSASTLSVTFSTPLKLQN